MNLTWRSYENHLKTLTTQTASTTGDKGVRILFLEVAKKTYKLNNYSELEEVLSKFFLSLKDTYLNSYERYHGLPDLLGSKETGETHLRSWEEIFPNRSAVRFGKKDDEQEISQEVWKVLKKIYDDWKNNMTRAKSLSAEAEEIIQSLKIIELELKLEQIKQKHPELETKINNWVKEFDKLSVEEKQEGKMNHLNNKIRYYSEVFSQTNSQTTKTFWEKVKDWKNWDWITIGVGALVTLLVLIIYRYLMRIFKRD